MAVKLSSNYMEMPLVNPRRSPLKRTVVTNLFPPDIVGQLSSVQTSAIAP